MVTLLPFSVVYVIYRCWKLSLSLVFSFLLNSSALGLNLYCSSTEMNLYREDNPCCCYFHPKEVIVGVCPLCLNERLLILAAKQGHHSLAKGHHRTHSLMHKKPPINLPKIFALGSFLTRLEFRHWKSDHSDHDASTSQEGMYCGVVVVVVVVIVSSSSESPFSCS